MKKTKICNMLYSNDVFDNLSGLHCKKSAYIAKYKKIDKRWSDAVRGLRHQPATNGNDNGGNFGSTHNSNHCSHQQRRLQTCPLRDQGRKEVLCLHEPALRALSTQFSPSAIPRIHVPSRAVCGYTYTRTRVRRCRWNEKIEAWRHIINLPAFSGRV